MQPRRVLLLTLLAALILYNLWRWNHNRTTTPHTQSGSTAAAIMDPSGVASTLWSDYDATANLVDAPDAQYSAANQKLDADAASINNPNLKPNAATLADIRGCRIWLQYYRQTVNNPHPDSNWKQLASSHIQSCTKNHADIAR